MSTARRSYPLLSSAKLGCELRVPTSIIARPHQHGLAIKVVSTFAYIKMLTALVIRRSQGAEHYSSVRTFVDTRRGVGRSV